MIQTRLPSRISFLIPIHFSPEIRYLWKWNSDILPNILRKSLTAELSQPQILMGVDYHINTVFFSQSYNLSHLFKVCLIKLSSNRLTCLPQHTKPQHIKPNMCAQILKVLIRKRVLHIESIIYRYIGREFVNCVHTVEYSHSSIFIYELFSLRIN